MKTESITTKSGYRITVQFVSNNINHITINNLSAENILEETVIPINNVKDLKLISKLLNYE